MTLPPTGGLLLPGRSERSVGPPLRECSFAQRITDDYESESGADYGGVGRGCGVGLGRGVALGVGVGGGVGVPLGVGVTVTVGVGVGVVGVGVGVGVVGVAVGVGVGVPPAAQKTSVDINGVTPSTS